MRRCEVALEGARVKRDCYPPVRMSRMEVRRLQSEDDRFARARKASNSLDPIYGLDHCLALVQIQRRDGVLKRVEPGGSRVRRTWGPRPTGPAGSP